MPSSSISTITGWTLSFALYFIIIIFGTYMLQIDSTKIVKYTASKNSILNVTLIDRQVKKVVKKKEKPIKEKKVEKKLDFKKLFGKINLDNIPKSSSKKAKKIKKQKPVKEPQATQKAVKTEEAKKIIEMLKFKEQENLITTQKDGIYDAFRGKITDILDSYWQETIDTVSGNIAKVVIGVDKFGNFSYKIETLSYSGAFNKKLRDFLEEMRDVEFPPSRDEEIFKMKIVFKDILE
ncbi:MAG: TonB C-terminal domain-containing protein [Sulfurospirillum sp.]|nr:TonB C-terminal domain-containing protein [Sulfurospirillum sp.]MBL0703854.1 TonB C-terminal domain-containing protein [Sulfurospirillum sp.]